MAEEKRPYELCTEGAGLALTTEEGVDLLVEVQVRIPTPHSGGWVMKCSAMTRQPPNSEKQISIFGKIRWQD